MGAVSVSSCITGRCGGAPTSCRSQMQLQERRHRCRDFVACRQRLQGGLCAVSRFSKRRVCVVGSRSGGFGPRVFSSGEGRLGFTGVRNGAVRAQEDEKENQELDKVEDKGSESWTSSAQRANVASRIFMAAFVWISLFFGISVANNEIGGGRPGRRGPRK